ncbi:MAG: hypothetical protein AMS27_06125, partial [Bacteroides sp. SM23_62_1]
MQDWGRGKNILSIKAIIILSLFLLVDSSLIKAQITSAGTGNWNLTTTWIGGIVPGAGDDVIIASGHTVTLTDIRLCNNITINSGGTLQITGSDFTVNGTTNISGTLNDNNNNGTNNFIGAITINSGGTWNTTAVTFSSRVQIRSNITNNSNSVDFGALRVYNNIIIDGTGTLNLTSNFNFDNVYTVTNRTTVTINGILNQFNPQNGTWINDINSTLNYLGSSEPMNGVGTFTANASGNTVNYAGTNQSIVTPSGSTYFHLITSGSNTKTLLGNISVNGNLTIGVGTMLDVSIGNNYNITIQGNWINQGTFNERQGTVIFTGTDLQTITGNPDETFYNLTINNTGSGIQLATGNVIVSNTLSMSTGNIDTGTGFIRINNGSPAALSYNSGVVLGELRRNINSNSTYFFPVGTEDYENFFTIDVNSYFGGGYLSVEYISSDPGNTGGFPITDGSLDILGQFNDGYWDATLIGGWSITNYDLILEANGFTSYDLNTSSRIIIRTNGGIWNVDGTHADASPPEVYRNGLTGGISSSSTQFGIGYTDCISFDTQPSSQIKCSGDNVSFSVVVSSSGTITGYQWQKDGVNITGETNSTLTITGVDSSDAGGYRCIVTTTCGTGTSQTATLSIEEPFAGLGYAYRKTITIDAAKVYGNEDLINFPLLVSLTDPDLATTGNGGYVEDASGYDIVFADKNGYKLDHQIEKYVATTGEYIAWVRIPVLSYDTDTEIDIIYGNPQVVSNPSTPSTWSGNYVGVYHLNNLSDATSYDNDGSGSVTTIIAGLIGDAQEFDASADSISITTNNWDIDDGSISAWVKSDGNPGSAYIFGHTDAPAWEDRIQLYMDGNNQWLDLGLGNSHTRDLNIYELLTGSWYYVVLNWNDAGNYEVFVNGVSRTSGTYTGLVDLYPVADIGNTGNYSARTEGWDGIIDEVRILTENRTGGW